MKILMIAPQPVLEPRGTPISVYQRLQALTSLGHQVDLLTYPMGAPVHLPNLRLFRIPRLPLVRRVRVGPSWTKLVLDLFMVVWAIRLLARTRYEVIHSHEEAAFFAMPLARLFGVKHLYDMHSSLPRQLINFQYGHAWPLLRLFEWLERRVLGSCDALITVGPDLEQYARERHPPVRQVMIENRPLPAAPAAADDATRRIREHLDLHNRIPVVYTGTFEPYQGIDLLVDCVARVTARHPEVLFLLVGGTAEQVDSWRQVAGERGLDGHLIFTGTVPVDRVGAYLAVAEILVSPRTEGTSIPLKLYTYLAAGKALVATDIQAHRTVLDDEVALLVAPAAEALADGIARLLRAPAMRRRLAAAAQRLAEERYHPDTYLAQVRQAYRLLAPGTPSSAEPFLSIER